MRWTPGGNSDDLEDRRGMGPARIGGGLGIGGMLLVVAYGLLTGRDPSQILSSLTSSDTGSQVSTQSPGVTGVEPNDKSGQFALFVFNDAQATWDKLLPNQYQHAKLVLFTDETNSGCGYAQSATGPFYCPSDQKVYIDLGFYRELSQRFGAPGEFAQAYVLAHEIGHHVQNILGIEQKVRRLQQQNPRAQNELSVRTELQADCLAGVWGKNAATRDLLDPGEVEQGLKAAAAIGDDRLQQQAGRRVSPESFTHGSSEQRVTWFRRGLEQGTVAACDTFAAR